MLEYKNNSDKGILIWVWAVCLGQLYMLDTLYFRGQQMLGY